jgi:hypothetical protein
MFLVQVLYNLATQQLYREPMHSEAFISDLLLLLDEVALPALFQRRQVEAYAKVPRLRDSDEAAGPEVVCEVGCHLGRGSLVSGGRWSIALALSLSISLSLPLALALEGERWSTGHGAHAAHGGGGRE